jgi:hypothetical protein
VDCGTHLIKYTRVEACSYCHLGTVYEEADSSLLNRGWDIVTSVAFSALPDFSFARTSKWQEIMMTNCNMQSSHL